MAEVRLRPEARLDLIVLHTGLLRHGERTADRYLARIYDALEVLRLFPLGGPARPDLRPEIRMWTVEKHIVYYSVEDDAVIVQRVMHHAQDARSLLR